MSQVFPNFANSFRQPTAFDPSSFWSGFGSDSTKKRFAGDYIFLPNILNTTQSPKTAESPFIFAPPPKTSEAGDLTPTELSVDFYKKLQEALAPGVLKSQAQQGLVNLAGAGAFGLMSLPITEFIKNEDWRRQEKAFTMREQSPTAQAARNLSFQQQANLASQSSADKMRAYGELKRNLIEPLRNR